MSLEKVSGMDKTDSSQAHPAIKDDDYGRALLHLAWYRDDQQRFLIFAMVELFPLECPPPEPTKEFSLKTRRFGNRSCVYLRRFPMTSREALAWYGACRDGSPVIPEADGQPLMQLKCTSFAEDPPWPSLVTSLDLPFHSWGTVRSHHLFQANPPQDVSKIFTDSLIVRWLSDRLFFDPLEHGEWAGSANLVAPNPLLRTFHQTLGVNPDGSEVSECHFVTRAGKNTGDTVFYLTEHRPTGMAAFHAVPVDRPYIQVPHVGRTEEVSFLIHSPDYGVLDWGKPVGFIRHIGLQMAIQENRTVVIPASGEGPAETYEYSRFVDQPPSSVGEPKSDRPITAHVRAAEAQRDRRRDAERLGQKWFHGDEQEARIFVRSLISSARRKVVIVDPYFAAIELFRFALATSRSEVVVTVLTAAEDNLKKADRSDPGREAGEVLLSQIKALRQHGQFEAFVMTGNPPPIHDRFLIVDDEVWLSGNSLHSIGERAGMMIKLPDPGIVVKELDEILRSSRVKKLEDWVADRRTAKAEEIGAPEAKI